MPGISLPAQLLPNSGILIARFPDVTSSMLLFTVLIGMTRYFVIYQHKQNTEIRLTTFVPIIISGVAEKIISTIFRATAEISRNKIIKVLTLISFNILVLCTKKLCRYYFYSTCNAECHCSATKAELSMRACNPFT